MQEIVAHQGVKFIEKLFSVVFHELVVFLFVGEYQLQGKSRTVLFFHEHAGEQGFYNNAPLCEAGQNFAFYGFHENEFFFFR